MKVIEKFHHMLQSGGEIPEHMQKLRNLLKGCYLRSGTAQDPISQQPHSQTIMCTLANRVTNNSCVPKEWARIRYRGFLTGINSPVRAHQADAARRPRCGPWDREVPKYTQIGNAVPVLLANKVAKHVTPRKILENSQ